MGHTQENIKKPLETNSKVFESQKNKYSDLLANAMEKLKLDPDWVRSVATELINLNTIGESEIIEKYRELLEESSEETKLNPYVAFLSDEEKQEYQRLKNIGKLAKSLGKEIPEKVKEKLEQYEKKLGGKNEIINEDIPEDSEQLEMPGELKDFRESWKEKIDLNQEIKELIIKAAEKFIVKVETESDGSRLIKFKLGSKSYKILDPKLKDHIDYDHLQEMRGHCDRDCFKLDSITSKDEYYIKLKGLRTQDDRHFTFDDKISNYIKEKQGEGLHIPKVEEMKELLHELGETAGIASESDEMAMLMYLTGMDGYYWLGIGDDKTSTNERGRTRIGCVKGFHNFNSISYDTPNFFDYSGNLCMMACE